MHTSQHEPPDPNYNYEVRDLPINVIVKSVVWFYVLAVLGGVLGGAFMVLPGVGGHVLKPAPDHYQLRRAMPENTPILQDGPAAEVDLANLRRKEKKVLEGEAADSKTPPPAMSIDEAINEEAAKSGK